MDGMKTAHINGKIIAWARKRANVSIESLASGNVSPEKVTAWERGDELPSENQAETLAAKLGIAYAMLFMADPPMEDGIDIPQAANVAKWSALVAGHIAAGSRNERIRGYLKALSKETWDLVNWLTHTGSATKIDGTMAIDATHSVLEAFGAALIRHERKMPERCGRCSSLRLQLVYMPELDHDTAICQTCGYLMAPYDVSESPVAIPL